MPFLLRESHLYTNRILRKSSRRSALCGAAVDPVDTWLVTHLNLIRYSAPKQQTHESRAGIHLMVFGYGTSRAFFV